MARKTKTRKNERALRQVLEKHRGDVSLYSSKAVKPRTSGASGSVVFSLRFSPGELEDLRVQAEARGITLSEMIRKAALDWGQSHRYQVRIQPHPMIEISVS